MSLLKIEAAPPIQSQGARTVLADMVAAFFRGKRMILAAVIAFLLLATGLLLLGQKTYESRMIFLVRDEGSAFPTASFEQHPENQPDAASDTQIGTEIQLLSGMELHRQG